MGKSRVRAVPLRPVPFTNDRDWLLARLGAPLANKAQVVAYMKEGLCVAAAFQVVRDLLWDGPRRSTGGGLILCTDGVWVWASPLTFYAEQYDLSLPAEFVAHLEESNWQLPDQRELQRKARRKEISIPPDVLAAVIHEPPPAE